MVKKKKVCAICDYEFGNAYAENDHDICEYCDQALDMFEYNVEWLNRAIVHINGNTKLKDIFRGAYLKSNPNDPI